ncbi:Major facilitator superfamily domain containing protein [Rhypophila decipiens]
MAQYNAPRCAEASVSSSTDMGHDDSPNQPAPTRLAHDGSHMGEKAAIVVSVTASSTDSAAPSATGTLESWRLAIVIGSLCLGVFLFGLDTTIIATAIPQITTEFRSLADVSWYGSAYLLTLTAFQPLFGNLYKYFNGKVVYLVSLVVFEAGSVVCAAAPNSTALILGRAILGLGAAGLLQGALAIIGYVVRLDKVPLFIGIVVGFMGISTCVGPILGGVLTQYATWRWCFWINVPCGVCVIILLYIFVPFRSASNPANISLPLGEKIRHMDMGGTVVFIGAICCLLLALTWGGTLYAWNDSKSIGLLVGFALLTIGLCYWLWRQGEEAMIPLRVLRQRSLSMGSLVLFCLGLMTQTYSFYLPIFFQSGQGVSTTESGIRIIAMIAPVIVSIMVTGGIVSTWGHYVPFMMAGIVVMSISAGFLTTIDIFTPTATWAAILTLVGIGVGMVQQLPYTALQAALEPSDLATGNAIAVFSYQLGGAIGIAIAQNLLLSRLRLAVPEYTGSLDPLLPEQVIAVGANGLSHLTSSPEILSGLRQAYASAVRHTFILALAAACAALLPACFMERLNIKRVAEERERIKKDQEQEMEREKDGSPLTGRDNNV